MRWQRLSESRVEWKLARRWRGGGGGGGVATLSHLPADTKMAEFSRQQLTCGTCFLCWAIMKRLKKTHKVRHAVLLPPGRGCWWSQGFSSFWSSCREGTLRDWGQFCLQVRCTFHFFHSPGLTFQITNLNTFKTKGDNEKFYQQVIIAFVQKERWMDFIDQ